VKLIHDKKYGNPMKTACLLIGMFLSCPLFALGVSDIELLSKLGEPLSARIQLNNAEDLGEAELIIRLAPDAIYKQLGVERGSPFYGLMFEIQKDKTVLITTREPIREPYLNFVLEFRWPEGELYKEYKVLIDPI
jgi:pilus assembly protein FimV